MDVSAQLETQSSKYKPITVEKPISLEFDLGLLAGYDTNTLDDQKLKSKNIDEYLKEYTRDGAQLLINELFKLPVSVEDAGVFAQLPDVTTVLPREKPIPKAKPLTRWEKFAKVKGIQKRKKDKLIYDDEKGEWVPRWGYKGSNDDGANDWLIPVSNNDDPYEDLFAKRREGKKQRIEKNNSRHQRNLEEAATQQNKNTTTNPRIVATPNQRSVRKAELNKQVAISKLATASIGKFDKPLEGEPKMKGVKRKFEPTIADFKKEKESNLSILKRVVGQGSKSDGGILNAIANTKNNK
ncbi:3358_t:CDS:2 [Ambispora gerdemannii]|uniref:Ribosome biogenesis regulatory protein n=1 Tax=Ambispora gerdemannii TaxID=144530 RepID=A0A9N9B1E0_9GLOM|nr:3358_t:CDS:2 [Ambispora gerdemannii]